MKILKFIKIIVLLVTITVCYSFLFKRDKYHFISIYGKSNKIDIVTGFLEQDKDGFSYFRCKKNRDVEQLIMPEFKYVITDSIIYLDIKSEKLKQYSLKENDSCLCHFELDFFDKSQVQNENCKLIQLKKGVLNKNIDYFKFKKTKKNETQFIEFFLDKKMKFPIYFERSSYDNNGELNSKFIIFQKDGGRTKN